MQPQLEGIDFVSTMMPITPEHHGAKRWLRPASYAFARKDSVLPLVASELPQAALVMPIGFVSQGEEFVPVAMVGLTSGENLFVSEFGGWVWRYVPSAYRFYPFALVPSSEGGEVLCIDEDSGLVTDGPEGEAFFGDDGEPSQVVAEVFSALQEISTNRVATKIACASLKVHELIQPWPITVQTPSGDQPVDGLYCINEEALDALPDEAFVELRASRALTVAFCQLLSMQHLPSLKQMAVARAEAATLKAKPSSRHGLEVLDDDRPLDFSRFR